jgi:hypothetical protein
VQKRVLDIFGFEGSVYRNPRRKKNKGSNKEMVALVVGRIKGRKDARYTN